MSEFLTMGEALVVFASQELDKPLDEVSSFKKYSAGAELNVAIGLSRLGYSSQYVTRVGKDSFGKFLLSEMKREVVKTDFLEEVLGERTGFYLKEAVLSGDPQIEYFRSNSAASHLSPEILKKIDLTDIKLVHVTGITAALSEQNLQTVKFLLQKSFDKGISSVFDPNLRPSLWTSKSEMVSTLNDLAKYAKIVLPGIKEGKVLTGLHLPEEIADFYLAQSEVTQIVIIKNGEKGAFVKEKGKLGFEVSAYKIDKVVDTVGAGDGFAVGLIAGLLDGKMLKSAVKQACALGALAVQSWGDNAGYPTRAGLNHFMEEHVQQAVEKGVFENL